MSEAQRPDAPSAAGDEYELFASSDNSLYWLVFKPDHLIARLTGDDATRFQADHAKIVEHHPNWTADQTLAQLWDQGGYSWLATDGD